MKKKKEIIPLPFGIYFSTITVLIFSGVADSIYLAFSHYRNYTDIAYKSFCAVSRAINCDTVSQSHYSIFGGLPWAIWGIIGYSFLALFLPSLWRTRAEKKRIWTLLFIFSFFYSLLSVVLAVISSVYIHSYCIMCVISFGINFLLFYFTWLIRKRYKVSSFIHDLWMDINYLWDKKRKTVIWFVPFFLSFLSLYIFFPKYWEFQFPADQGSMFIGVTEDGHPWIGAQHPVLEITEFTDYQCFQCRKMHFFLRQLIKDHPGKIRLIHRHYPMDSHYNYAVKTPFHEGSGELALIAIYAGIKGKFWKMNDLLFNVKPENGKIRIKDLADKLKLDFSEMAAAIRDKKIRDMLAVDLWAGYKLGITGTPSYLIDGKVYKGQIPPEIIEKALEK